MDAPELEKAAQTDVAKVKAEEAKFAGYVKTHLAVIGAVVAFLIGLIVGHFA